MARCQPIQSSRVISAATPEHPADHTAEMGLKQFSSAWYWVGSL